MGREPPPTRILFVCLGNICRSPMADGAMRVLAAEHGLTVEVDSAGTGGWHVGEPPDPRAIDCAAAHGVDISGLRGRQVTRSDFGEFDYMLAMDERNLADLQAIQPRGARATLSLLLDHVEGRAGESVGDPYYGGTEGFERVWSDISAGINGLAESLTGLLAKGAE